MANSLKKISWENIDRTSSQDVSSNFIPFSWQNWQSPTQSGIFGWAQGVQRAWGEQRFDDVVVELDYYLDHMVPLVNDLMRGVGLFGKANCYLAMGNYEQALNFLEQVEGKVNSHPDTLANVGDAEFFNQANAFLSQYKGLILLNLDRTEEALELLRENPPTVIEIQFIYQEIEKKLDVTLLPSDYQEISGSSQCSTCSYLPPLELSGAELVLFNNLIGNWLAK